VLYPDLLLLKLDTLINWELRDCFLAGSRERISRLRFNMLVTLIVYYVLLSSNAARSLKMLVFDWTRPSPLFWHFCSLVHRYSLSFDNNAY
jgi:hypothetical protein